MPTFKEKLESLQSEMKAACQIDTGNGLHDPSAAVISEKLDSLLATPHGVAWKAARDQQSSAAADFIVGSVKLSNLTKEVESAKIKEASASLVIALLENAPFSE
jgi:hypothetical protein